MQGNFSDTLEKQQAQIIQSMSEDQPANLLLHQRIQLESINRDMQIARSVKKILDCFSSILDPA